MTTCTIPLPWPRPPLSANSVRDSHHLRGRRTATVVDTFRLTLRAAKVQPFTPPVAVTLHHRQPDWRRRDADGLAATLKPLLDAIVREGLLPDDSARYVPRTAQEMHPPDGPPAMWLEVEEVAA